ncbi:fascin-3 [Mixophyes fleayi]|uniref:fascin-3 n=1 Tax=Mixophyes fleayi TaxID=3061075 RepID=UPI003F4D7FC8
MIFVMFGLPSCRRFYFERAIWELTHKGSKEGKPVVDLKSQDGLNLVITEEGTVRCFTACQKCQQGLFQLINNDNGTWTLKSLFSHKYLESDGEKVFCSGRTRSSENQWIPHLAIHAHIVLYHLKSNCYARVDIEKSRIYVDLTTPCLASCGFVLRFKSGKYHLETSAHNFLSSENKLEHDFSTNTAFDMHLKPGCIASFRNLEGHFIYPQGIKSMLLPGQNPPSMQELFIIKRCPPWVTLQARSHRYLAIVHGEDVKTTSKTVSVFHFQMDSGTRIVRLSSKDDKYLALRRKNIILVNGHNTEKETAFKVRWRYGAVYLRACNNAYLSVCPTDYVVAKTIIPGVDEEFILRLSNRCFLVLRGHYGYIGHSSSADILQCNSPVPECIEIKPCKLTIYHFKGHGRNFWNITHHKTFHTNGRFPSNFCIEIRGRNILTVLAPNGLFLRGDKSGTLIADSSKISSECLWEF